MGDYSPVAETRRTYTFLTSGAVVGGNLLAVTGSGTVAKANATDVVNFVAVAAHDAPSGGRVTAWLLGSVHESISDGAIPAGSLVTTTATANRDLVALAPSAADLGATYVQAAVNTALNAAINASRGAIGIALTTGVDGAKFRWMLV